MRSLNLMNLFRDGETSLMKATLRSRDEIVDLLLKSGANVDAVDK